MIVVGCDPGGHTGLVTVEVGADGTMSFRETLTLTRAATSLKRSRTDAQREHARMIYLYMERTNPDLVLIEEPWDVSDGWGGGGRRVGTGFHIGAAYGYTLAMVPPGTEVLAFPVRSQRQGKNKHNKGWVRGTTKLKALGVAKLLWENTVVGAPPFAEMTEHEQVAAAVILRHLAGDAFTEALQNPKGTTERNVKSRAIKNPGLA